MDQNKPLRRVMVLLVEGWTSQDWLRTGYELDTKRRNQSFDWLRFKANTT